MKSNIKILLLLIVTAVHIVSCSDDFLKMEPTGYLSSEAMSEIAQKDPQSVLDPLVSGLYSTTFMLNSGGSVDRNDMDYGQKNIDLVTDLMSGDMAGTAFTYNWYRAVAQYTDQIKTGSMPYMAWRYYYRLIKSANEVIDILGGEEAIPEDAVSKAYYGQAKTMRAYAYYYLVNLYQHAYSDKKDSPGVPLYITQLEADMKAQSPVSEVYELIIDDLEDAVVALRSFDRAGDKSKVNQEVAFGLLAYAYLTTGEYVKAAAAADSVIAKGYPVLTRANALTNGFHTVSNNWIWGIDVTPDNYSGIACWWSHVDLFTYGYASAGDFKVIDSNLYASIPAGDVRKNWFGDYTGDGFVAGASPLLPVGKFFDPEKEVDGDKSWTNDLVYMRVEEMYLVKAEALANNDNLAEAKNALKVLLDERNPDINLSVMDKTDLLNTIYQNWRIEMWGEGKSYFALKRFKRTVTRSNNHALLAGESFPYNYQYMIFEIPEREQLNNPNLLPQN